MEKLTLGKPRTGVEVRWNSQTWVNNNTIKGQDKILRSTGVRYFELNQLSYRNPVQHVALGFMHNWMEGVLMHHFRESWGFKTLSVKEKRVRQGAGHNPSKRARFEPPANDKASSSRLDEDDNQGDDVDEDDVELNQGPGGLFTELDMRFFRLALTEVILPTAGLHPKSIGCRQMWEAQSIRMVYTLCICHSFDCVGIPIHRQRFKDSYQKYNVTSVKIFKDLKILPNHHYALHIPEKLKLWRPLGEFAEFTGERMIGKLRSIETNNQLGELETTMVKQFSQMQRMEAKNGFAELFNDDEKIARVHV
ncbi:hypothetical protein VP01_3955g2 [Puccinia sorghi]|uniref:Uncharacterized protein n=1 Tax=Puccinia sorghi TaxID=27349 RepID=A0A0L6UT89_9BASI|nr:hypothetical protein VP01_3955g2 [Puccinia sorghi]